MRKPLAQRKIAKRTNRSVQYASYLLNGSHSLESVRRAFELALIVRKQEVLAVSVKEIMDVEPSVEDLDIRTYP